jgi:hypothetical protein
MVRCLLLAIPLAEIPDGQQHSQIGSSLNIEFPVCRTQAILHRFVRNVQLGPNLTIGIAQTGQGGDIFLTLRQRFPGFPESFGGSVLCEAGGQEVRNQVVFRSSLVLGNCFESDLQAVTRIKMIRSRAGCWAQAYPVQKAIPDRHTGGIIVEQMC